MSRSRPNPPPTVVFGPGRRELTVTLLAALGLALAACGSSEPAGPAADASPAAADAADGDPWAAVRERLDDHEVADMTLLVGDASGVLFAHEKGASTADTEYRIASATKWITAATIMRLVEAGELALDDHPQDYIDFWTADSADPRSRVTLEQLLSFTSGFRGKPGRVPCTNDPASSLAACVEIIYDGYFFDEPGTTYHYGPAHMHTAGLMAERATATSWQTLVSDYIAAPLGFDDTISWAMAGPDHPMPSGGLRTSARSYGRFLQAIAAGEILAASRADMAHPRSPGLVISHTPIDDQIGPWPYALGQWRECDEAAWSQACDDAQVSSSPGAFGFYPWYDHGRGYWAVLATEQTITLTYNPVDVMVPLGQELQPLIEAALAR